MVGEYMSFIDSIKSIFKRGGMALTGQSLTKIADHPKIGVDAREYDRIKRNFDYYGNKFDQIKYRNSYGDLNKREFKSLNITKTASRRLASIIFNEKCNITLRELEEDKEPSTELQQAIDFLTETLKDNNFYNLFETNLEKGIAAGGFAMRPYVDHDKIKISWIRADQFYPLRSNTNEISECAIATKAVRAEGDVNYYYTLLEFHEWEDDKYIISNELYKSDNTNEVGKQVPLETIYEDVAERVEYEGMKRPLFAYFKTPGANNKSLESPLGAGIVDNAKEVLDVINTTHDEFAWEVHNGQRKVVVPAEFLRVDDSHPPYFDTDQNVFAGVHGVDSSLGVKDITTTIRSAQYKDALNHFLKEFEAQIGLSTGTMSYADDGLKTATEVVSNNSMTYQTRSSYLTMVTKVINELIHSIFELAGYGEMFSTGRPLFVMDYDSYKVDINYEDGLFVDQNKQLENDLKALTANVLPKREFLKRNYGLSDKEVDEWMDELDEQTEEYQQRIRRRQGNGLLEQGE
ncbi:phage portal protein [Tetragenococcus halophilus]|uniref:phage portal protein n=1 Tax=Tetragenococcus halophilus TaxID=51669 RepID=UPI00209B89FC|nr:phage portal protein [Tetragenococcus halophilus]MCO8292645.1 phage portal protein [Tetragenococcus halophilus]